MLDYQLRRLEPHFRETLLLTGPQVWDSITLSSLWGSGHSETGPPPGLRPLVDPPAFVGHGPLAGLLAALRECRGDWLALMPVDCPFFPPDAFHQALSRCALSHRAIGFVDHEDQFQWLPGLYHRALVDSAEAALAAGERRLGRWMRGLGGAFLSWEHKEVSSRQAFINLNSVEQAEAVGLRRVGT